MPVLLGAHGALSNPCCRISGCLCCWVHMVAGQGALKSGSLHGRAVEFPDACAAGRTGCPLKSGRLNFRVPVLLGTHGGRNCVGSIRCRLQNLWVAVLLGTHGCSQIRAVEFPGACAAGRIRCPLQYGRLNFQVLVLLGTHVGRICAGSILSRL